jgi:hypothetical protein
MRIWTSGLICAVGIRSAALHATPSVLRRACTCINRIGYEHAALAALLADSQIARLAPLSRPARRAVLIGDKKQEKQRLLKADDWPKCHAQLHHRSPSTPLIHLTYCPAAHAGQFAKSQSLNARLPPYSLFQPSFTAPLCSHALFPYAYWSYAHPTTLVAPSTFHSLVQSEPFSSASPQPLYTLFKKLSHIHSQGSLVICIADYTTRHTSLVKLLNRPTRKTRQYGRSAMIGIERWEGEREGDGLIV